MADTDNTLLRYVLGFRTLHDALPGIVGNPLENEQHNPENGDALQATTGGLLVWRKRDNWTAFTDGYRTWVNGPNGIEERLNSERFDWEREAEQPPLIYQPAVLSMPARADTFPFLVMPRGFILHGTRSGLRWGVDSEFNAAAGYETTRTDGLAPNCTIGEDRVAIHIPWRRWGWNAYRASMYYISMEIAQGVVDGAVTDGMVRAIAWVVEASRQVWGDTLPLTFITHSEAERGGLTGTVDGKTDIFPFGDARTDELRSRIFARLKERGIS